MTAPRLSANRELIVRPPQIPYVHAGTARPRVGQSRAPSSLAHLLARRLEPRPVRAACRTTPSWSARVGSARPCALVPPSCNRCSRRSPMAPWGTTRSGACRQGQQRQQFLHDHRALGQRRPCWIRQPARLPSCARPAPPARNHCRAETLICGSLV
jgi:hypothetical protein